ncbi:MAG: heme-binding protein [Pseudomonadota bacterium]
MAADETPDYIVIEELNDIEIRDYPPMLLASVIVSGDRQEAANKAFQILAGFIFGDNQADDTIAMTAPVTQARSEKIDMTAPVTQASTGENEWRVDFMMPSKYSMESLPKPNDPRIAISETAPYRAVAISFSGRHTDKNFDKHQAELDALINERRLITEGPAQFAYYDGPFTAPFLRRNEIIYRLAAIASSG